MKLSINSTLFVAVAVVVLGISIAPSACSSMCRGSADEEKCAICCMYPDNPVCSDNCSILCRGNYNEERCTICCMHPEDPACK
ncbi:hypothetical protein CF336_g9301 [Tilletia laevis]|nr:hypothetical protein CF336_g9301 [Tilletia laevis]KAE8180879.1 hypothetical protein CF335_g9118 [Tilletia laevis]